MVEIRRLMTMKLKIFMCTLFFFFIFAAHSTYAEDFLPATADTFKVSPLFGDNMVFQQNEPIKVWGTSPCEGKIINARLGDSLGWGKVLNGKWEITLAERCFSSEPTVLEVYGSGGKSYFAFTNILIGDVWWVLGQSNVEYTLSAAPEAESLFASLTGNENVVICQIESDSFAENSVRWRSADRYSMYTASALGCFLGIDLDSALHGEVPIAIVSMGYSGCELSEFMPKGIAENIRRDGKIYTNVLCHISQMPIRGMIWYQGESDANSYSGYASKLSALIGWLRNEKDMNTPDFPVYAVELPPCFDDINDPFRTYSDFGCVRGELGSLTYLEKNFYVCPTSDLWSNASFSNNIHPDNKSLIAKRLSLMLLSKEYGFGMPEYYFGPLVKKVDIISENKVIISFGYTGKSLSFKDLSGFVVIGGNWQIIDDARIELQGGESLVISSDEKIYTIRYNTKTDNVFGKDISLANSNSVPAPAFTITLAENTFSVNSASTLLRATLLLIVLFLILLLVFLASDFISKR